MTRRPDHTSSKGDVKELLNNLQFNIAQTFELIRKAESARKAIQDCLENESTSLEEAQSTDVQGGLRISDRVVWMVNDEQPELGTVKWLGLMSDGLVAGVEFDEPIGNTDGNLDGKKLFQSRLRHGRFVLVRELILWSDFSGERVK